MDTQLSMQLISIVIACYNNEETIERAINSALAQDWSNLEIIIVDDCSTDGSGVIIRRIASKNKCIKLITHSRNLGYPSALNSGISASSGTYIAFFDADDYSYPFRLSEQVKRTISYKEVTSRPILCYSNREIYKNSSSTFDHIAFAIGRQKPEPSGHTVANYLLGLPVCNDFVWGMFGSCTLLLHRSVIEEVGYFDPYFRRCAEWDYAIRASFVGAHFISVDQPLIRMYKTSGNYKSGKKPLLYSIDLRRKHDLYLKSIGFYRASIAIAHANFFFNKKKFVRAYAYKLQSYVFCPSLIRHLLKKIFKNLINLP